MQGVWWETGAFHSNQKKYNLNGFYFCFPVGRNQGRNGFTTQRKGGLRKPL